MHNSDKPGTTVDPLKEEIHRLLEKQGNALKVASHIGLTPKEASQCNDCHAEIVTLVEKWLESAESVPKVPLPSAPRKSKDKIREDVPWWGLLDTVLRT